jgi:DNA-binding transcriptional LysR family regulator
VTRIVYSRRAAFPSTASAFSSMSAMRAVLPRRRVGMRCGRVSTAVSSRSWRSVLGVELTIRQGRQLKLTAAGEELAALTREHFTWLGDFAAKVSGTASLYAIGAGESLIDWLLLPRLSSLSASLPGVSLRLDNLRGSEIVERLQDRVLDFGVLNADRIPAGFDRKSLGQLRYRLAVPSGLLAKDGAIPAIAELPLAVMTPDSNIGRVCLEALGHGVRPSTGSPAMRFISRHSAGGPVGCLRRNFAGHCGC